MIEPVVRIAGRVSALVLVLCATPAALNQPTPSTAAEILDRALAAAGGERALAAATVLKWSARAAIHTPQRRIQLEGRWIVEPPDRAVVSTWEVDKGESSTRRLIVLGSEGWMDRGGQRAPMPPDVLAHERDQFYLYSVVRLVPLREPGVQLSVLAPEPKSPRGLRVRRTGRPDVDAFFDESGRLARLRTRVTDPATKRPVLEEVSLEGTIAGGGVRWPRTVRITFDGAPYFDMELFQFSRGTGEELSNAARAK